MRFRSTGFWTSMTAVLSALAVFLPLATACGGESPASLTWDQVRNAAYPVDLIRPEGVAQLVNGEFRQVAPGSATETVVRLADIRSFGKIDDNDSFDAAPLVIVDTGGSGTFVFLAAALYKNGEANIAAMAPLGDAVTVQGRLHQAR